MNSTQVAIFERTRISCDLMFLALTAPEHGIGVVYRGTSSEISNKDQLKGANVALISSTLDEGLTSGIDLLRRLTKAERSLNCVLLADNDERDLVTEAFRAGAVGVFQRDQPYEQLIKCIKCVQVGQVWASGQQMRYAIEALASSLPIPSTGIAGPGILSKREEEIVAKVAEGLKNREIANLLFVSEHTIKNHLFRIFERLNISSRAELILYAYGRRSSMETPADGTLGYRSR
jgi:DNA-binding NarL/FixJ family response regulator